MAERSTIHNRNAPYWASAMILLGIVGIGGSSFSLGSFSTGYLLDMAGPAWNYILFRGLFTRYQENMWTRFFNPTRTFLLFILICFSIEFIQYFQLYDSTFDPYDFLAYISILTPVYIIDRRQQTAYKY